LVRRVTIPVSAGLLADTNAYFKALTAYRQGDIEPIVSQLAAASIRAAGLGRWLVDQLADVRDGWLKRLPSRTGSAGRRLASILVGQPAVNVTFVVERLGVSATAARRAIDQAIAAGLLVETSDRKRNRVWIAREALAVFDEFSDRAGRRV